MTHLKGRVGLRRREVVRCHLGLDEAQPLAEHRSQQPLRVGALGVVLDGQDVDQLTGRGPISGSEQGDASPLNEEVDPVLVTSWDCLHAARGGSCRSTTSTPSRHVPTALLAPVGDASLRCAPQ